MKILASSEENKSLGNWFREKRFGFFKSKIEPLIEKLRSENNLPLRILDVGGLENYWTNRGWQNKDSVKITLLNLSQVKTNFSNIESVAGDATDLSQFEDGHFDLVFSNSVIEHLYTYENQRKMASEATRVGVKHFIQTPNKSFFIEPHYLLPFFQFLPKSVKYFILTKTPLSRGRKWDTNFAKQYVDEIRLLSRKEMKILFPGSDLYDEKFLGLTKSFTAHNFD